MDLCSVSVDSSINQELEEIVSNVFEIYAALNISDESWYEYNREGNLIVGKLTADGLAKMVHEWRYSFFTEYNWGLGNRYLEKLRLITDVLIHCE